MAGQLATPELSSTHQSHTVVAELIEGLQSDNKYINPKFFYDEIGSDLFEQITALPEYYPTRTELGLLNTHGAEIAATIGQQQLLVEPGAGSCVKVRTLLPSLKPRCFIPIDVSAAFLLQAARRLQDEFPQIDIRAVAADMQADYAIPEQYAQLRRTVFYPGSTIGNYAPDEALQFLQHVRSQVGASGSLLIGVDLQKDPNVLHRAYNDSQGTTALFNLNVLNHVNRLLGADFDVSLFEHVAFYNQEAYRIEMHLESAVEQTVALGDQQVHFSAGEKIHTEYSYKYTLSSFSALAAQAGFKPVKQWVDDDGLFSLQYFDLA